MKEDHWTLIKKNISDPLVYKQIEKGFLKRARITALLLGSFLIVALLGVVYGFVQSSKGEVSIKKVNDLQVQVAEIKKYAEQQVALATEAKIIAEEAAKLSYEQLEECRNKK